jgi:hypothetical protein
MRRQSPANADAKLEPRHRQAAERAVEEAERLHRALAQAVEDATDKLLEVVGDEAEKVLEAARRQRELSAQQLREAIASIEPAVGYFETLAGASRWAPIHPIGTGASTSPVCGSVGARTLRSWA